MGFWNSVGDLALKAGGFAIKQGKEAIERSKQYKEEMPQRSDADLLKIIKGERSRSPLKAGAAMQELEARGYSKEEIQVRLAD